MWISSLAAWTASSEPVAPRCKYVFRALAGCAFHRSGSCSCLPTHRDLCCAHRRPADSVGSADTAMEAVTACNDLIWSFVCVHTSPHTAAFVSSPQEPRPDRTEMLLPSRTRDVSPVLPHRRGHTPTRGPGSWGAGTVLRSLPSIFNCW